MKLVCAVGSPQSMFAQPLATEVAGAIDHAFGAEGDWEGIDRVGFGDVGANRWLAFQQRAKETLEPESIPNVLALCEDGRCVFLPTHVRALSLSLSTGCKLRCASLPGLREELAELAQSWDLPLEDVGLRELLSHAESTEESFGPTAPECATFARLALAANEAIRRDCPLWLVDEAEA